MGGGEGKNGAGARCEEVSGEELSAHVDGALGREEAVELGAHLRACAACRERRAGLVRARDAVRALGGKPKESPFFLEKLDARLETELAVDGLGIKGRAGSGRYTRRRPRETSYVRVAASVIVIIGASIAVRVAWNEWKHPGKPGGSVVKGPEYAPEQSVVEQQPTPLPSYPPEEQPPEAVVQTPTPPPTPAPPVSPRRGDALVQNPPPKQAGPERQAPPVSPALPLPPRPRSDATSDSLVALVTNIRASLDDRRQALYELANRHEHPELFFKILNESNALKDLRADAWSALTHFAWDDGAAVMALAAGRSPYIATAQIAKIDAPEVLTYLVTNVLAKMRVTLDTSSPLVGAGAVARGLAQAHAEGVVNVLIALLSTTNDVSLRAAFFEALGDAGGEQAAQALASALSSDRDVSGVRVAICRGLARTAGSAELATLTEALRRDASPFVRAAAAQAIGRRPLRAQEAQSLEVATRDPDIRVRSAAAVAIAIVDASKPTNRGLNASPSAASLLPLQPQGVIVVLDKSPSLQRSGLTNRAIDEGVRLLSALPNSTPFDVGLVTSNGVQRHSPSQLAVPNGGTIHAAEQFLAANAASPDRHPNIYRALADAALMPRPIDTVVFVTDGASATSGTTESNLPFEAVTTSRAAIYVILVGDPLDPMRFDNPGDGRLVTPGLAFLRRLAEDSGGALVRNDHP